MLLIKNRLQFENKIHKKGKALRKLKRACPIFDEAGLTPSSLTKLRFENT